MTQRRLSELKAAHRDMPAYASIAAFELFLERIRTRHRNALAVVDRALLQDYGIPAGATSPLLTSLKWLGVVDVGGRPTEKFDLLSAPVDREIEVDIDTLVRDTEADELSAEDKVNILKRLAADEFKGNMAALVREAYTEEFARLDLKKASRDQVKAYFSRNYSAALAEKATNFFLYLCQRAGTEFGAALRMRRRGRSIRGPHGVSTAVAPTARVPVRRGAAEDGKQGDRLSMSLVPVDLADFWSKYIGFLEALRIPLDNPRVAAEVARVKADLIARAIAELASLKGQG